MTPKRPPLSNKRAAWAGARGGASFRGTALTYNAATEERYRLRLERAIADMTGTYRRELTALYRMPEAPMAAAQDVSFAYAARVLTNRLAKRFFAAFAQFAFGLAVELVRGADKQSKSTLHASLAKATGGLSLKTSVVTGRVEQITKAAIVENVALIKSIPSRYAEQMQAAVMRSIVSGNGLADLTPQLDKLDDDAKGRAALIARDQTSKATTAINRARMQDLGIRKFEWVHSGGGKEPRRLHLQLDGQTFSVNDPPVIDERTGERGLPGQLINCRCRMAPVVDFSDE